jgi:hypothetical protein
MENLDGKTQYMIYKAVFPQFCYFQASKFEISMGASLTKIALKNSGCRKNPSISTFWTSTELKKYRPYLLAIPGVDVVITIFCDLRQFSAEKNWHFSLKLNVMITFFSCDLFKKRQFLRENIF